MTANANELDEIHSVSTRLRGYDLVLLEQAIARWKMEIGSRRIDTSVALNAAALLVLRASDPNLVREHAEKQGMSDAETEKLAGFYKWFQEEYFDVVRDVIATRKRLDGRLKRGA
ncbi:hypothetical protein [Nocardia sp. NPDC051832]|uniref:hypothetical protein n=1 Tax=Nocardia sp. NPDC051832 TaxID=3155673 RepID=UPI0034258C05